MTACRVCDGTSMQSVLDLGHQPLANRLVSQEQLESVEVTYPLHLVRCNRCSHFQLTHTVDPEILYHDYPYASGHSEGWHTHSKALAEEIAALYPSGDVLDVAANDCTLLGWCHSLGLSVIGVEPARNLGTKGLPVVREFFSLATAERCLNGPYQAVVAQNVFGHVDDPRDFLAGVARVLSEGGVAIIECPWIVDLLRSCRWDTVYHEHLSYWGVTTLERAAKAAGLCVNGVKYFPELHGGTMRYYLSHKPNWVGNHGVYEIACSEALIPMGGIYRFQEQHERSIYEWSRYFLKNTKVLAGFGASAKSATFLNAFKVRPPLTCIFDDSPLKQGLYTPGWHYPIVKPTDMISEAEELINLAPNWPLEERARALGFAGEVKNLWSA